MTNTFYRSSSDRDSSFNRSFPVKRICVTLLASSVIACLTGCGSTGSDVADAAVTSGVTAAPIGTTAAAIGTGAAASGPTAAAIGGSAAASGTTAVVGTVSRTASATPSASYPTAAATSASAATASPAATIPAVSATAGAATSTAGAPAASTAKTTGTASTATATPAAVAASVLTAAASQPVTKSIASYVSCTGTTDDNAGVAKAMAAAANSAFTLVVDCPVYIKVGSDIARPIFIGNDTSVQFTGTGKFIVDNEMIPAFVIADSSNISLINWSVEYTGSIPVVEMKTYENAGQPCSGLPGNAFNDVRLTQWLAANRGIVFSKSDGSVMAQWSGTTNMTGVFYITGDVSGVSITGMDLYVPKNAGGDQFIPAAFSLSMNYKRNQTVSAKTPMTAQYFALPNKVTFSNVTLDGTYMGWVGGVQNGTLQNITSQRYGDLQDAKGDNIGGVNKWFAPPHLIYFTYNLAGDSKLFNTNITIENVTDNGIRVGKARDRGGSDSISGYANSLKLGCVSCSVNNYLSARPDGLMDILNVNGLTVSNVSGTYDSAFTNNLYPGWRFPDTSYENVKFENVSLTDTAANTVQGAIGNAGVSTNQGIVMSNVQVALNQWNSSNAPFPTIAGPDNTLNMNFAMLDDSSQHLKSQSGSLQVQLVAMPVSLKTGQSTNLAWKSWSANSCSGSGPWSGVSGTNGGKSVKFTTKGVYEFSVTCRNSAGSTTATAVVDVTG